MLSRRYQCRGCVCFVKFNHVDERASWSSLLYCLVTGALLGLNSSFTMVFRQKGTYWLRGRPRKVEELLIASNASWSIKFQIHAVIKINCTKI